MVLRRKTVNKRAAKAQQVDHAGHGRNEPWNPRAPPDAEYWQRASDLRWHGMNAHVSYWSTNRGDWYGLKVDPIAPDRFATNWAPWGGVWHITLGHRSMLNAEQQKALKRLQAKYTTPQRMELHFGQANAKGNAPLYHTDPIYNDPLVNSLNFMERPLHVTM